MPHVRWDKGGEARVLSVVGERVTLASSIASAPGSSLSGSTGAGTSIRVKVARCKRHDGAGTPGAGVFLIEGRLIDATRDVRVEIAAIAAEDAPN